MCCFPDNMRTCIVELKELVEQDGICSQAAPFLSGFVQETDDVSRDNCLVRPSSLEIELFVGGKNHGEKDFFSLSSKSGE